MISYYKVLISKKEDENNCYGEDGEILIFSSEIDKRPKWLKKDEDFFVTIKGRKPSLYGWVSQLDRPITVEEFAKIDLDSIYGINNYDISSIDLSKYKDYLDKVNKYPKDTPMAASWSEIGILEKKRVLKFHKVIFF